MLSDTLRLYHSTSSPNSLVLEDGTAIVEVPAICRYIEEIHPAPSLLGATAKEKAQVTMWERRVELEGFAAVMEAIRSCARQCIRIHYPALRYP
jgi:glutathione S-transferase